MFEEPLALVTAIATALLFLVNWRAANAAKNNAALAAREFRLLRRPLVTVTWTALPDMLGDTAVLVANVTEVAGVPTTLHSVEARATPKFSPPTPAVVTREEPDAPLSGDVATFRVPLYIELPKRVRQPISMPGLEPAARGLLGPSFVLNGEVAVANLEVTVVISVADEQAAQEAWTMVGVLYYDRKQQLCIPPEKLHVARLGGRQRSPRSRLLDPVLRAWERWWDSVC